MAPDISFEEKIDYIYKELQWQKRTRFLNFAFKSSLVLILVFWAFNISKWLENDTVISKISSTLWTIVKPIVTDLINNTDINNEILPTEEKIKEENNELINNKENEWL